MWGTVCGGPHVKQLARRIWSSSLEQNPTERAATCMCLPKALERCLLWSERCGTKVLADVDRVWMWADVDRVWMWADVDRVWPVGRCGPGMANNAASSGDEALTEHTTLPPSADQTVLHCLTYRSPTAQHTGPPLPQHTFHLLNHTLE